MFDGNVIVGFFAVGGLVEAVPCFALVVTSLALMSRGLRGGSGLATRGAAYPTDGWDDDGKDAAESADLPNAEDSCSGTP